MKTFSLIQTLPNTIHITFSLLSPQLATCEAYAEGDAISWTRLSWQTVGGVAWAARERTNICSFSTRRITFFPDRFTLPKAISFCQVSCGFWELECVQLWVFVCVFLLTFWICTYVTFFLNILSRSALVLWWLRVIFVLIMAFALVSISCEVNNLFHSWMIIKETAAIMLGCLLISSFVFLCCLDQLTMHC